MNRTPLKPMSAKYRAKLATRTTVRQTVLDRDRHRCQFWTHAYDTLGHTGLPADCAGQLEVHEVIPRSAWPAGQYDPGNCVTLCHLHHQWVTEHPTLAHFAGLHGYSHERPTDA